MADKDNLEELKTIPHKERIKKLKELQEKNKKEIEEAKELISKSEDESLLEDAVDKIPLPEVKKLTIEDIFGKEDKTPKQEKKEEEQRDNETEQKNLENAARPQNTPRYGAQEPRTMNQLRDDLYSIQNELGNANPNDDQRQELYRIGKELYEKDQAVQYMNDQHAKGEIQKLREKQKDLYTSRQ